LVQIHYDEQDSLDYFTEFFDSDEPTLNDWYSATIDNKYCIDHSLSLSDPNPLSDPDPDSLLDPESLLESESLPELESESLLESEMPELLSLSD